VLDIPYVVGVRPDHLSGPHVELIPDTSTSMPLIAVHQAPADTGAAHMRSAGSPSTTRVAATAPV
jgi:hypothetical protein